MLCKDCSQKFYIANVGACVNCGSFTSSGSFKLCNTCSKNHDECKHCRKSLKADAADNATSQDK